MKQFVTKGNLSISFGFLIFITTILLVSALFVWAVIEPPLQKVWRLEKELSAGSISHLKKGEKKLFYEVIKKYPAYLSELSGDKGIKLMSANINGRTLSKRAVIITSGKQTACRDISVNVSGSKKKIPAELYVEGFNWSKKIKIDSSGIASLTLPESVKQPQIIEISPITKKHKSHLDLKVRFCTSND
ncbi:MAG: hypothetical protein JXR91_05390 [Deltaproteobacteria bacterium]|nr:hypothetical protein [Deltaproteobacteria bacterium]